MLENSGRISLNITKTRNLSPPVLLLQRKVWLGVELRAEENDEWKSVRQSSR